MCRAGSHTRAAGASQGERAACRTSQILSRAWRGKPRGTLAQGEGQGLGERGEHLLRGDARRGVSEAQQRGGSYGGLGWGSEPWQGEARIPGGLRGILPGGTAQMPHCQRWELQIRTTWNLDKLFGVKWEGEVPV